MLKEASNLPQEMMTRVTTIDAMVAVGVEELTEIFVSLHERFAVFKGILRMNVIVCQSVAEK